MHSKRSKAVLNRRTIIQTAALILEREGRALRPSEMAEIGIESGLLRVPRGRTRGYLAQLLQSELYNNAHYRLTPIVRRTSYGRYKALA